MLAVLNKELRNYFTSATGYIFAGVFLLFFGLFFALYNLLEASANYNNVLDAVSFLFLILVPILTMKIVSEETHQKTDQLLLTSPVSVTEIILGKYFAAVTLYFITIVLTCINPLILSRFGSLAYAQIIGGYVGFFLLGCALISIGVFISALTESQVVSAVATFGILLIFWLMDWIQQLLPTTSNSGMIFTCILVILLSLIIYFSTKNMVVSIITALIGSVGAVAVFIVNKAVYEGFTVKFISWISLLKRYQNFSLGVLDLSSLIYYITVAIAFIFLTIQMIEKRRWS